MRPLPIHSRAVALMDWLLRRLPRRHNEGALQPVSDLVLTDPLERQWLATGTDPAFHLSDGLKSLPGSRWYYVECYLRKHTSTLTKLYLDLGQGFSETHTVALPVTRRGYVREVVRLPDGVRGLRLDPTEASGYLVCEWMSIQAISGFEATMRRLGRVLYDYHRFSRQDETRDAALHGLRAPLLRGQLQAAYAQSASMRIPSQGNESITDLWHGYQAQLRAALPRLQAQAQALAQRPLISVVVPTYNTPPLLLRALLRSVQAQVYPHWELVVWDDASAQADTRRLVAEAAAADGRIKAFHHPHNQGVAATTNAAVQACQGEYVVFLDHDDLLEPQALLRVAQCAAREQPDFAYADEVIVTADGQNVVDLVLRPAFSLEYFRHHPYVVHPLIFRKAFLQQLGGLDESLRISQDVDLVLRAAEQARTVAHIPEVLYQWRTVASSAGHARQSEVTAATVEILQRHLARCGEAAPVQPEPGLFNYYRPQYPWPADARVAVIIPTKNHHGLVRQCVESLERTTEGLPVDLVVVDHASDDPESVAYFDSLKPRHTVLSHTGPFNFSTINNAAVRRLHRPYTHYLFCNNDVEALAPGWLQTMLGLCARPGVGIVGAHLLYGDRVGIQHGGVGVGMFGAAEHYGKFQPHLAPGSTQRNVGYRGALVVGREVSAVTAACLLMRRSCFEAIGGFDESLAVGFGDVDLCLRAVEKGWRVLQSGGSVLIHHESRTRGTSTTDPHPEDSARFMRRWRDRLERGDPYFHPWFSEVSTAWLYREPLPMRERPSPRLWHRPAPDRARGPARPGPATRPQVAAQPADLLTPA